MYCCQRACLSARAGRGSGREGAASKGPAVPAVLKGIRRGRGGEDEVVVAVLSLLPHQCVQCRSRVRWIELQARASRRGATVVPGVCPELAWAGRQITSLAFQPLERTLIDRRIPEHALSQRRSKIVGVRVCQACAEDARCECSLSPNAEHKGVANRYAAS